MTDRAAAERIALAVLQREPGTLGDLQAILGADLGRDVMTEDAFLVRRNQPCRGVDFLYAGLIGHDLRRVANPMLAEVRLSLPGADVHRLASGLLGPGVPGERGLLTWARGRGQFDVVGGQSWLYWKVREPAFAPYRDPAATEDLLGRLRYLLTDPLDVATVERAFGPLAIDGRWPQRLVRHASWEVRVRPVEGPQAEETDIVLSPPLACAALAHALGWDALVSTVGVHMSSLEVVDRHTLRTPEVRGARVHVHVTGVRTRADVQIPAAVAYTTEGAEATAINVRR